jgi:hypothetical protein
MFFPINLVKLEMVWLRTNLKHHLFWDGGSILFLLNFYKYFQLFFEYWNFAGNCESATNLHLSSDFPPNGHVLTKLRKYFLQGVRPWLCIRTRLPKSEPQTKNKHKSSFPCAYPSIPPEPTPYSHMLIRLTLKQRGCSSVRPFSSVRLSGCRVVSFPPAAPRALAPCTAHLRLRSSVAHCRWARRWSRHG